MVNDLPGGMPRLMQKARGYIATFVSDEAVRENGVDTGARPDKMIRSGDNRAL